MKRTNRGLVATASAILLFYLVITAAPAFAAQHAVGTNVVDPFIVNANVAPTPAALAQPVAIAANLTTTGAEQAIAPVVQVNTAAILAAQNVANAANPADVHGNNGAAIVAANPIEVNTSAAMNVAKGTNDLKQAVISEVSVKKAVHGVAGLRR